MKKKWLGIGLVVALMVIFAVPGSWALDNGPETISINAQEQHPDVVAHKDKKQYKTFAHKKHQEEYLKGNAEYAKFKYTDDYTCAGCHHKTEKGGQPVACLKCKDGFDKMIDKVSKGKGIKKFQEIYHINCRDGCHDAMHKAGKKTGPSKKANGKCKACHPKQKK